MNKILKVKIEFIYEGLAEDTNSDELSKLILESIEEFGFGYLSQGSNDYVIKSIEVVEK